MTPEAAHETGQAIPQRAFGEAKTIESQNADTMSCSIQALPLDSSDHPSPKLRKETICQAVGHTCDSTETNRTCARSVVTHTSETAQNEFTCMHNICTHIGTPVAIPSTCLRTQGAALPASAVQAAPPQ